MNTLRSSLIAAASPGSSPTTSIGIPSGPNSSAKRAAAAPETSVRVASPVARNDSDQRDVDERHRNGGRELALERG